MLNHAAVKLGKQTPKVDKRTLQLANYLGLPPAPISRDWTLQAKAPWGMMANDTLGDCTCAAAGHIIQTWSANTGTEITITDEQVISAYSHITGYNPDDPMSDQGAVEIDVLNYWRKKGIGGHKITAYAAVEPGNKQHIEAAIDLFGGVYIGLSLPLSAQTQRVWSVPPGGTRGYGSPGSWGGHAVVVEAYNSQYLTCITWGQKQRMTWSFWNAYCDEAYGILSPDWVTAKVPSPAHFDLATLLADLKQLGAVHAVTAVA